MTLTKGQMQLAERLADQNGLTFGLMMENAGIMASKYILTKVCGGNFAERRFVILAGNGNNAGDALVVARLLSEKRCRVTLVMCVGKPLAPLAVHNYERLLSLDVKIIDADKDKNGVAASITQADVIIDGIFGISFHGELEGSAAAAVDAANYSCAVRVALDLPSGVVCDNGQTSRVCFNAAFTLAFAAYKPAHSMSPADKFCGTIAVLDIGIPSGIIYAVINHTLKITPAMVAQMLPKRASTANKGDFGKLLNISGSATMTGAAMMSTLAAMRSGAGIVRLATVKSAAAMVAPHLMEAITIPLEQDSEGGIDIGCINELIGLTEKSTACLLGCGLSVTASTKQLVEYIIKNINCSLILDADGLNCIAGNTALIRAAKKPVIITPHIGEMARLVDMSIGDVIENAQNIAKVFAKENNCTVVLKSHKTLIATQSGELYENTTGNAGLAKGGSGDVLAGMIASLTAQGLPPLNAAICGVYLHGDCADSLSQRMSLYTMLARDIIEEIPFAFKRVE